MTVDTNLSQTIDAIDDADAQYDANIKNLLADRQILARIMKYTLNEFSGMQIEDIMKCIGKDIEISKRPLEPGLSNLDKVRGDSTEDTVLGEGTIWYDIRFSAYIRESEIKILLNIEAQKSSESSKLGYHLENRIMFYLSRMVSAQKQMEFFNSDYDSIKPVRSIWICMDSAEDEDSIREIGFEDNLIFGNDSNSYDWSLMKAVIVKVRNKTSVKSANKLIAMLEELISDKDINDKKESLNKEYGMKMTVELEGRLNSMCNWSQVIKERSIMEGIIEGKKQGIKQGIKEERLNTIERMIKANYSDEQICGLGYTEKEIQQVKDSLFAPA